MSIFLIVIGAVIAIAGIGSIGFGIPVKEFSFGDTLIVAGSVAVVGGVIVMAIGAVVGRLQRIAEMLVAHEPAHSAFPVEALEPMAAAHAEPAPAPVPFPTRTKLAAATNGPEPATSAQRAEPTPIAAPTLPNPDLGAAVAEQADAQHKDASPSPPAPSPRAPEKAAEQPPPPAEGVIASLVAERRGKSPESPVPPPPAPHPVPPDTEFVKSAERTTPAPFVEEDPWHFMVPTPPSPTSPLRAPQPRSPSSTNHFDTVWPPEARSAKRPMAEAPATAPEPPPLTALEPPIEPVAILKSGVVDDMAYTLYVDGSIEAELPTGTIRFASINELRDHLAKSS